MLRELPAELRHFVVHDFGAAYPDADELLRPADGSTVAVSAGSSNREGVWPLDSTDGNGVVFTGRYVSEIESQHARCLTKTHPRIDAPHTGKLDLLFKRAFRANEPYSTTAELALGALSATTCVTIRPNPVSEGRAAVIGRLTAAVGGQRLAS